MSAAEKLHEWAGQYSDQMWRLHNLYWIVDKLGQKVLFKPNEAQLQLLNEMWWRTDILKARQFGFTTQIDIFILDTCLFNPNTAAGIIAHTLNDAEKIFDTKVKYPYDNLPEGIKTIIRANTDSAKQLKFSNGSAVSVGTSYRSGTLQILHISEYGKIAATRPDKALEIKTGAIEAVPLNGMVIVESTAEGQFGEFYERVKVARQLQDSGQELSKLDSKFFFMPWWRSSEYVLDVDQLETKEMREYFKSVEEEEDTKLTRQKRNWYIAKQRTLGEEMMWREYPSTPDEAFQASVNGAYWGSEMTAARKQGRIGKYPPIPGALVTTWWDIGRDTTSIWLTQEDGGMVRCIYYYENAGRGIKHYVKKLDAVKAEFDLVYGEHNYPHDMRNQDWGADLSRIDTAKSLGYEGNVLPRMQAKEDGIEAGRMFIPRCLFDEKHCAKGIAGLTGYRKKWDDRLGTWAQQPLHDSCSHPADAFQQLSLYHSLGVATAPEEGEHGGHDAGYEATDNYD